MIIPIEQDSCYQTFRDRVFYIIGKHDICDPNDVTVLRAIDDNTKELGFGFLIKGQLAGTFYPSKIIAGEYSE